jgi:hypothetical protein
MAADSKAKQIRFPFQALAARWLIERDAGQLFQPWRRNQPALARFG